MKKLVLLVAGTILLGGCASAVKRHELLAHQLQQNINCETAKDDIAKLEQEKATVTEKVTNGIASILPTSVVFNLLTGEFSSRKAIATGEFDEMLFMKIEDIENKCFMTAKNDTGITS